jgi:nitronate monooxygenase
MRHPTIIQGGMGAGVSSWRLARAVSAKGQLGVVSGTALDSILARRLQLGDSGGHMRRALEHFPVPAIAQRIRDKYYIPGGKGASQSFLPVPVHSLHPPKALMELTVLSNFAEVFLAKEGHNGPVGINYLEKAQLPNLASLYGAMLAGVDYVLMGAGIPREIPGALDALSSHADASLKLHVEDSTREDDFRVHFSPEELVGADLPPLKRPYFLAIVASVTLALTLSKKANGQVDGFVVESSIAGGHNAPPRGALKLSDTGEPIYGPKDQVDTAKIAAIGLPFWIAGGSGRPGRLQQALDQGGAGIQVGTAFLLCEESGLDETLKRNMIKRIRQGQIDVFTDPVASPTGFPFKVVPLEGTLSEETNFEQRPKICDLGYLQISYKKADGTVGRRCPAEPVARYEAKGGNPDDSTGKKCLCNGLMANIGLPQVRSGAYWEKPLLTAGEDINLIKRFLEGDKTCYSAAEVVDSLLERA